MQKCHSSLRKKSLLNQARGLCIHGKLITRINPGTRLMGYLLAMYKPMFPGHRSDPSELFDLVFPLKRLAALFRQCPAHNQNSGFQRLHSSAFFQGVSLIHNWKISVISMAFLLFNILIIYLSDIPGVLARIE